MDRGSEVWRDELGCTPNEAEDLKFGQVVWNLNEPLQSAEASILKSRAHPGLETGDEVNHCGKSLIHYLGQL